MSEKRDTILNRPFYALSRAQLIRAIRRSNAEFVIFGLEFLDDYALLQEAYEWVEFQTEANKRPNRPHLSDRGVLYRPLVCASILHEGCFFESSQWVFERSEKRKAALNADNYDIVYLN